MNKYYKSILFIIITVLILMLYQYIKESFFPDLYIYTVVPFVMIYLLYRIIYPTNPKQLINEYYIKINEIEKGPFTIEELKDQDINFNTLIYNKDLNTWKAAKEIEQIRSLIYKNNHNKNK